jgi:hypothetical protein
MDPTTKHFSLLPLATDPVQASSPILPHQDAVFSLEKLASNLRN